MQCCFYIITNFAFEDGICVSNQRINRSFCFISPLGTTAPEHLALECGITNSKHQNKEH